MRDRAVRPASGSPYAATRRAAVVRAAATETCWPSTARTALSAPSTAPGARRPARGDERRGGLAAEHGRVPRAGRRRGRAAVRQRWTAAARSARPSSLTAARTWSAAGSSSTTPAPLGRRSARRYAPSPDLLDPGHRAGGEPAHERRGRRTARRTGRRSAKRPGSAARPRRRARRSSRRRRVEDLPDRVVELPDAREAGGERDLGERQRRRLEQHPRGLRPLRAGERERRARRRRRPPAGGRAARCSRAGRARPATPSGRPRRPRSAASRARRGRRARSHSGEPGTRPGGSACTRGSRPPAPPPRSAVEAHVLAASGVRAGQLGRQ